MSSLSVWASWAISSWAGPTGSNSSPGLDASSLALRRNRFTGLSAAVPMNQDAAPNARLMMASATISNTVTSLSTEAWAEPLREEMMCHWPFGAVTELTRTR